MRQLHDDIQCLASLLLLALTLPVFAQSENNKILEQAKRYEVKPMELPPKWSSREGRLFRIAWVSDLHYGEDRNQPRVIAALQCIRQEVKPIAVVVTGDNCANPSQDMPGETLGIRRHNTFKALLDKELGPDIPALVIPGDNFYQDFDKIFGADKYSVTVGGFKFIFSTVDASGNVNGCSIFSEESLNWIQEEINSSPDAPVLYFQHEPVLPVCFLDASKLQDIFDNSPQLLGVFCGHIHLDMEFSQAHWTQWLAPSVGRSHRPAFKVLDFYKDRIVCLSYEWDTKTKVFSQVLKFQKIDIPIKLRRNLCEVTGLPLENIRNLPVHSREFDSQLDKRYPEIDQQLKQYMIIYGIKHLLQ